MIYLKISWTVRVFRESELEKQLALPLVDSYNNEPSIDITKIYQELWEYLEWMSWRRN